VSQHDMCHRHSTCPLLLSCRNSSDGAAGHEQKEKDLSARQAALQGGEQQLHAEQALEETLKVCSANQQLSSSVSANFVPAVQL